MIARSVIPNKRERCPTCKRSMPRAIPKVRKKPRRGPMRDPKYRAYIKMLPCVVCQMGCRECGKQCVGLGECVGVPVDPAHTQNNGMRSKGPDSSCAPLCRKHHEEYDSGRAAFEKKYRVDMAQLAADHYARYLKEKEK